MIAACYDLRLQCDAPACANGDYGEVKVSEFVGDERGGQARARARRAGWWLDWKLGTCACPKCKKAGHRPKVPA